MELRDALSQIADIRLQMARTRVFRGYRSTTTLFSALVAVATAIVQSIWIPDAPRHVDSYLTLWFSSAVLCLLVVGAGIFLRYWKTDSSLHRELTFLAIQQFIPCIVVGGLLTYILMQVAWSSLWLVPGLWIILFGMGVLASRQLLPRAIGWIGAFYLLWGLVSIGCSTRLSPFSPWVMGIPFGVGQALSAAVLYWELERDHAAE